VPQTAFQQQPSLGGLTNLFHFCDIVLLLLLLLPTGWQLRAPHGASARCRRRRLNSTRRQLLGGAGVSHVFFTFLTLWLLCCCCCCCCCQQAGSYEPLTEHLPGAPDGVSTAPDGNFWVGLVSPIPPISKLLRDPTIRALYVWLPTWLRPPLKKWGAVTKVRAGYGTYVDTFFAASVEMSGSGGAAPNGCFLC
jgi:hypothetical protein